MLCTVCSCGAVGAAVGGGVAETEGPRMWAGAGGHLHFSVSFTPLSYR